MNEDSIYLLVGLGVFAVILAVAIPLSAEKNRQELIKEQAYNQSLINKGCKVVDHIPGSTVSDSSMGVSSNGGLVTTSTSLTIPDKYKYQCDDNSSFWLEKNIYAVKNS